MSIIQSFVSPTYGGLFLLIAEPNGFNVIWESGSTATPHDRPVEVENGKLFQFLLEDTVREFLRVVPDIEPLSDYGDYYLFHSGSRVIAGVPLISIIRDDHHDIPVRAKHVIYGATLTYDAARFFRFWLGRDQAVINQRLAVWLPEA